MTKVLVLSAHDTLDLLKEDLLKQAIQLTNRTFSSVTIEIVDSQVKIMLDGISIDEYDFVWLKSSWIQKVVATAIDIYLKNKNKPFTPIEKEVSKLSDYVSMALGNVSIPNTFYSPSDKLINHIDQVERVCSYPIIVKIVNGSLGRDIFLANSKEEFIDIVKNKLKEDKHYICQEFIPNHMDYRVVVSDYKVLSVRKKVRETSEYRNNVDLGAKGFDVDLEEVDEQFKDLAVQASKAVKLDWTGIDIVQSLANDKYYIFELNRRPGITQATLELTAVKDHLLSLLKKNNLK